MANITTQTIRVDLSTDKVLPTAFTHQNDTARTLEFSMYNKGVPYDMTGNTVKFAYKSPIVDGAYTVITGSGMESGTVDGNKVTVTLPNTYTAISGVGMLTMIITPTSGTVRPVNIRLVVQKSADGDDTVMGASDFPVSLYEYMDDWLAENEPTEIANIKSDLRLINFSSINTSDLENGFYSTVDGSKRDGDTYIRAKNYYRINGGTYYYSIGADVPILCCLYDANMNYIGYVHFYPKNSPLNEYVLENAVYAGLFFSSESESTTSINIVEVDSSIVDVIEFPFNNENYGFYSNHWMNGNGTILADDTYSLVTLFNVKEGEKYFVSNSIANQGLCKDSTGTLITPTKETVQPKGQIITVPEGTKTMYFNIDNRDTEGTSTDLSNYISKITKNDKILCIGDSLTYLDGRGPYGGARNMNGYQAVLRKSGYAVYSAGYSGNPYATGVNVVDNVDHSIYKEIVTESYNVSGYDIIILAGGTNDLLYDSPIGTRPTDYTNRVFNSGTFNGAIGGIINYIRTNNESAKIIIWNMTKATSSSRIFTKAINYVNEIEYNSIFWSAVLCDTFRNLNVQPSYNGFSTYFYDTVHPNSLGMKLIGNQILHTIESSL